LIFKISAPRSGVVIALIAPHASRQKSNISPAPDHHLLLRFNAERRPLLHYRFAPNRLLLDLLLPEPQGRSSKLFPNPSSILRVQPAKNL